VVKQVKIKTDRSHKKEKSSDSTPKPSTKDSQKALMDSFKKESILERVDEQNGVSPREENPAKGFGHKRKISITNTLISEDIKLDSELPIEPVEIKEIPEATSVVADKEIPHSRSGSEAEEKPQLTDGETTRQDVITMKADLKSLSRSGSSSESNSESSD